MDPQKQVTDLTTAVESGSVDGAWAIMIAPPAAASAGADGSGQGRAPDPQRHARPTTASTASSPASRSPPSTTPPRARPWARSSATASTRSSTARRRSSTARAQPGTAGKEEQDKAIKEALAATAPDAEIVSTITISDRAKAQTDVGSALQGNPDITAVMGQNDEGSLGALGAFAAAGKELPCLTETGGNEEVLAGGRGRQDLRLRRPPVRGRHGPVVRRARRDDRRPRGDWRAADRAPGSREGRQLTIMTTPDVTQLTGTSPTSRPGRPAPAPRRSPPGSDVPRSVSVLVFLRDRGIFMLWGLLIVFFAFWASPYFFTMTTRSSSRTPEHSLLSSRRGWASAS